MSSPSVTSSNTAVATAVSTTTISLTTINTNDIVLLCSAVENDRNFQNAAITYEVQASGLNFLKRSFSSYFIDPSNGNCIDTTIWWALASTIFSGNITVDFGGFGTIDDIALAAIGISGCNPTNPWDTNFNLPVTSMTSGSLDLPSLSITTTNPNDLILAFIGQNDNGNITSNPVGFSTPISILNSGGTNYSGLGISFLSTSSIQTSLSVAWGSTMNYWAYTLDALTAD